MSNDSNSEYKIQPPEVEPLDPQQSFSEETLAVEAQHHPRPSPVTDHLEAGGFGLSDERFPDAVEENIGFKIDLDLVRRPWMGGT